MKFAGHPLRLSHRRLALLLLGLALCVLLAFAGRAVMIRRMLLPRLVIDTGGVVTDVSITPDGRTLFSGVDSLDSGRTARGRYSASVSVWDADTGRLLRRLHGCVFRSESVTASPDGHRVIAVSRFEDVLAWDWATGQRVWTVAGSSPVCFSPDGQAVGVGNTIYDASTGKQILSTSADVAPDGQEEFTPDRSQLATIGAPKFSSGLDRDAKAVYAPTRLRFCSMDSGKTVNNLPFTRVRAFDISADGDWVVMTSDRDETVGGTSNSVMVGGTDGSVVRRVDLRTGAVAWTHERRMNGDGADTDAVLNSVAISPNGRYVVLQSTDSRLIVLNARTGREQFRTITTQGQTGQRWAVPGGIAFSQDGSTLVSRCGSQVLAWDATSLQ